MELSDMAMVTKMKRKWAGIEAAAASIGEAKATLAASKREAGGTAAEGGQSLEEILASHATVRSRAAENPPP